MQHRARHRRDPASGLDRAAGSCAAGRIRSDRGECRRGRADRADPERAHIQRGQAPRSFRQAGGGDNRNEAGRCTRGNRRAQRAGEPPAGFRFCQQPFSGHRAAPGEVAAPRGGSEAHVQPAGARRGGVGAGALAARAESRGEPRERSMAAVKGRKRGTPMSSVAPQTRLLVVDDDRLVLANLGDGLEQAGYAVSRAVTGEDAIRICAEAPPDLVITARFRKRRCFSCRRSTPKMR
ncbi:MAG: transcriptional regulator [Candidatus Daviesbacteria bacterium GW2011_GWC2_40_12]|uniref:Transcriptional regulator n=1 Tax=Candidatus Daviesbacteria bacterium GW2011_GWC2_40_12 TaxID=1618431 RepID=A0A0G0QLV2_9BACT|nr:MAG: transcriptional regulator [Candidatus Daviesbacteria bacterium GW2011_GWC2_40_12]